MESVKSSQEGDKTLEHESIRLVPRKSLWTRMHTAVLVLSISTALCAAAAVSLMVTIDDATVPGKSAFLSSMGVEASSSVPLEELSSSRMQRVELDFSGTLRENTTIAAGRNQVMGADGSVMYVVYTEVVSDVPEAAYTTVNGITGGYSLRLRVHCPATGEWAGIVPFGLSAKQVVSPHMPRVNPNMFLFHYMPTSTSKMVVDLVGTQGFESQYSGKPTFYLGPGRSAWEAFMVPFLVQYERAYEPTIAQVQARARAHNASHADAPARMLSSYGGSETEGGAIGGDIGGDVGSKVGGDVGSDVGGDVGEDVGEAAGDALAGPIGGAVGGWVGKEVGSYVGKKVGSAIGQDLGSSVGTTVGNAISNAGSSSSSSSAYSYSGSSDTGGSSYSG